MPKPEEIASVIRLIEEVAHRFDAADSYFVGGYPRALAMGLTLGDVHDLDVASGNPYEASELAGFVAETGADDYKLHHRTNTITVFFGNVEVDFQGPGSHDHVAPYVRLWGVEETLIAKNVFDRDFTMNALAIKIGGDEILDITRRGMSDIYDKRVASILPPDVSVPRNPLMITRAIRFAAKYGYRIEKGLLKAMKENRSELEKQISPRRLAIEAYVLAKYPETKDLMEEVGIGYLEAPKFIEQGKESAEE
jgi:poly(A) polymerase